MSEMSTTRSPDEDSLTLLGSCTKDEMKKTFHLCESYEYWDGYRNECSSANEIQFGDEDNEMTYVYGVLFPILALLVLNTNGVVILVLRAQKMKRASVEPLFWMAVAALFMAISPLPFTLYYYNLSHMTDDHQTEFLCHLHKISMEVLPFFFNTIITFLTLLLGVQRFIAVQFPLRSFYWCSRQMSLRAMRLSLFVAFLLSLLNYLADTRLLFHLCAHIIPSPDQNPEKSESVWVARCFVGYSPLQLWLGVSRLGLFLSSLRLCLNIVPSCTLFILTILLIRTLRDSHQLLSAHRHHGRKNRSTSKTTVMLTVIIILFLVARLPSTILLLLNQVAVTFPYSGASLDFAHDHYLLAFTNITFMTVHPLTLAVYLLMSRRFRVSLRRLLGIKWLASDSACVEYDGSSRTATLTRSTRGNGIEKARLKNNKEEEGRKHSPISISSGHKVLEMSISHPGPTIRLEERTGRSSSNSSNFSRKGVMFHPVVDYRTSKERSQRLKERTKNRRLFNLFGLFK